MSSADIVNARPWELSDLYNRKAHLRAVPIIAFDRWEETGSEIITTDEIHAELLRRGLLLQPMSKRGAGNLVGAFRQREFRRDLAPPLVEQVDEGIWRFNCAEYDDLLRRFRDRYPIRGEGARAPAPRRERPAWQASPLSGAIAKHSRRSFGAPMDFRGLRHSPINELGVVFLFGIVCRDLGYVVESVHTEFPDCEAKRCVDVSRDLWERVRIEFEYESRNFREHKHDSDRCDVIVCWAHNWPECPMDVIELREVVKQLASRDRL